MTTPREKYQRRKETLSQRVEAGRIRESNAEKILELCNAYDDDDNIMGSTPHGESSREVGTLMSWSYRLMAFAQDRDLLTATTKELEQDIQAMHDGDHPAVKDDGIKKSTLRSYQAALRKFYGFHDALGVDPSDIPMFDQEESGANPADMLTKEEIQQAREAVDNPRDKLIFELLLYTGQRREALRTLRLKDVFPKERQYQLNSNVDGLKGATKRNGKRPLLGAIAAVRDWINNYHPDPSDGEHYLITARPSYAAVDPTEPISGETIRKVMSNIKDESGITKPLHPHAMRHNFVTIAKRDYDLDNDIIKYMIGHSKDSTVMETTYSHLSDEDHIKRAEEAWGIREEEDESPLSPDVCETCGSPLPPNAKACSRCGTVYTPDAKQAQEQLEEAYSEAQNDAADEAEAIAVDDLKEAIENNPELKTELITQIAKEELHL